jgi:predicted O-methyltransferase YrrM
MASFRYTQNWFAGSDIRKRLLEILGPKVTEKLNVLEIGCFEGMSSVFFAENLLNHPESTMTCVDPFMNFKDNDHAEYLRDNQVMEAFDNNIRVCKNAKQISVFKITSDEFFAQLNANENAINPVYDIIYIDGCHLPDYIHRDMSNSFSRLRPGGIMWMDDYQANQSVIRSMENFLASIEGQYTIVLKTYQLAIQKIM